MNVGKVKTKMGDPAARRMTTRSLGNAAGLKIYEDKDDQKKVPLRRSLAETLRKPANKPPIPMRKSIASHPIPKVLPLGDQENRLPKGFNSTKLSMTKEQIRWAGRVAQKADVSIDKIGRVGRKALVDMGNLNACQSKSKKTDNSVPKITQAGKECTLTTRRAEKGNTHYSKSSSIKDAPGTRTTRRSITTVRTVVKANLKCSVTRKPIFPITRTKPSISAGVRLPLNNEKKGTLGPLISKGGLVTSSKSSLDKSECECSAGSGNAITTIITRPKVKKRRSFTSMLMSQSEVDLPNIDDNKNELEVAEYVDDIYWFYWNMEAQSSSLENYMKIQIEITPKMRAILVNWLIEVHMKFELIPETLFLMVGLLDRFLSANVIKRKDMQLLGLTMLLIASKYEDFWHPKVSDLIGISADSCTRLQMLSMERFILNKLRFRLNVPTPYVFMKRFLKAAQADSELEHLSFYLVELCQIEYESLNFKASLLSAAAIYLARCTLQKSPAWTKLLQKHARYEETDLRSCAEMILRLQRAASEAELTVSHEKYLSSEYNSVAAIKPIDKLPTM